MSTKTPVKRKVGRPRGSRQPSHLRRSVRIVFQSTVKEAKSIRERALKAELSVPAYIRMVLKEADEDRRVEVYTDSQAQAAPQVLDDQTDAFEHPTGKEVKIVWKEGRP